METLELLRLALRYVHLVGVALLLGGAAAQLARRDWQVSGVMLAGAVTQVATGLALAAALPRASQPDPAKIAVKAVIAVVIVVLAALGRTERRGDRAAFLGVGGLTLANMAVATFWV